jgi:hypothetical protein
VRQQVSCPYKATGTCITRTLRDASNLLTTWAMTIMTWRFSITKKNVCHWVLF